MKRPSGAAAKRNRTASGDVSDKMTGMMSVTRRRSRVKVGATLDPELVDAVDDFVARHDGVDRSAVIDDALRLWCERQQDLATERQIREDKGRVSADERAGWRSIQAGAAARTFRRR
jgi:Arc/MetJ-type ribon-helix-helix transcriptional regulator